MVRVPILYVGGHGFDPHSPYLTNSTESVMMKLWLIFAGSGWNTVVRADKIGDALGKVTDLYKKYNDGVWPRMKVYEIK